MASGTFYPAVGGDDGFKRTGLFNATSTDYYIGRVTSSYDAWVRFQSVSIPQGATVTNAFIRFTGHYSEGTAQVRFRCVAEDNATAPTSVADYDARSKTSAYVDWTPPVFSDGVQYDSPSLISIIQEIVDRSGWASDNSIVVYVLNLLSSGSHNRRIKAYENGSGKAELHVEWTTGGTEELEDISLDLTTYYQSLENFGTWLRAHDGLEFEDLASHMEAAKWTTEDLSSYLSAWYESLENAGLSLNTWGTGYEDLQSWLAAYHRSIEDAKTDLSIVATAYEHWKTFLWAAATVRKDLASSLQAYGRELQDLPSFLRAVGYRTEDLKGYFETVSSTVLASLGLFLTATDGVTLSDLCVNLTVIKKSPQFRSVVAQRVSSVISEVV